MDQPTGSLARAPLTIVAVYAHPDDGEFHAAGSLAKWAAQGHHVHAICATDGALGSKRRDVAPGEVAAARARELASALAVIGAAPPILLGFPDGFLIDHRQALRERLIHHLRRLRADRVITFDPHKRYEIHPDHLTVGRMASEAAVFSCFPLLHPEHLDAGLDPVQPQEVWYMGPLEHKPNRVIDIAGTLKQKIAATLCHESQIEMLADWFVKGADPRALTPAQTGQLRSGAETFLEGMGRGMAMAYGGKVEIAECFYALPVGPGHFDNYQQMAMEQMGAPPEEPQFG
jgi:LmbE family N-acetylglucosaminyl deacetylase